MTVAKQPGHRGARHNLLKPSRAGMPGDSGVLVVTRVRSTTTKCTRGRGCSGHPAFPTPSQGAEDKPTARVHRAARSRTCVWNEVHVHDVRREIASALMSMRCDVR